MNNLIYQYWDGIMKPGIQASIDNIKNYAETIGVEHRFELNPRWRTDLGKYSPHFGQFKLVYNPSFDQYDNILFLDADIFAVDGLQENIFDGFDGDVGICTEPWQPENRVKMKGHHISAEWDERWDQAIKKKWNVSLPRNENGLIKVYNSGVVLYSRKGINKIKQTFVPIQEYNQYMSQVGMTTFYKSDQPYLHAMMVVTKLNYVEMDNGWNSYIHYIGKRGPAIRPVNDSRTSQTKFVHIQLSGGDDMDDQTLWRIVNRPESEWRLV